MQNKDIDIISRLSTFEPFYKDNIGNQLIDYLVLDALLDNKKNYIEINKIENYIKKMYNIKFELTEIKYSIRNLKNKEMVEFITDAKGNPICARIKVNILKKIKENIDRFKKLEKKVFERWKSQIFKELSRMKEVETAEKVKNKIDLMEENLKVFISKMFVKHGIECVTILYPKSRKLKEWLGLIKNPIFNILPSIDESVDNVLEKIGITTFFMDKHVDTRAYINNLFNSSFYWHLIQIDKKCSQILSKKKVNGQKLFLDTNFMFSLAGLHEKYKDKNAQSVLNCSRSLGYKLFVTNRTLREFNDSMNSKYNKKIFIKEVGEKKWNLIYNKWIINQDKTLKEKNITKTDLYQKIIEESEEYLNEQKILRANCKQETLENIIKHDAFHKVLIKKIRGNNDKIIKISNAKAWFLTEDIKLINYANLFIKKDIKFPYCLSVDQWIQINRPLLPRIKTKKNLNRFFFSIITTPSIRSYFSPKENLEKIKEIENYNKKCKKLGLNETLDIIMQKHFNLGINNQNQKIKNNHGRKIINFVGELAEHRRQFIKEFLIDFLNLFREKITLRDFVIKYKKILIFFTLLFLFSFLSWNYLLDFLMKFYKIEPNFKRQMGSYIQLLIFVNLLNIFSQKMRVVWVASIIAILIKVITYIY